MSRRRKRSPAYRARRVQRQGLVLVRASDIVLVTIGPLTPGTRPIAYDVLEL